MRYDRARGSLDRHATYSVAAHLAGAAGKQPIPHRSYARKMNSVSECVRN